MKTINFSVMNITRRLGMTTWRGTTRLFWPRIIPMFDYARQDSRNVLKVQRTIVQSWWHCRPITMFCQRFSGRH